MVALQTLLRINESTSERLQMSAANQAGPKFKDVFAISTAVPTEISKFKETADSQNLQSATAGVARAATESVVVLLQDVKGLIESTQKNNIDPARSQIEIDKLIVQIESVIKRAQFKGSKLFDGTVMVQAPAERDSSQRAAQTKIYTTIESVKVNNSPAADARIVVGGATTELTIRPKKGVSPQLGVVATETIVTSGYNLKIGKETISFNVGANDTQKDVERTINKAIKSQKLKDIKINVTEAANPNAANVTNNSPTADARLVVGGTITELTIKSKKGVSPQLEVVATETIVTSGYNLKIGKETVSFNVGANDTQKDVARTINKAIKAQKLKGIKIELTEVADPIVTNVTSTNNKPETDVNVAIKIPGAIKVRGILAALGDINVTTSATTALVNIESVLQAARDAAADFESSQNSVTKFNFSQLFADGIGNLVETDFEETSARLQALQVKQVLKSEALSIVNQRPEKLMYLFRS